MDLPVVSLAVGLLEIDLTILPTVNLKIDIA